MSILKFENRTPKTLSELFTYLTDLKKTDSDGIFGIGCNPNYAVAEMQFVQHCFFREKILHPYIQVIFAFDIGVKLPFDKIKEICIKIGELLSQNQHQVFAAIHYLNTDKIHCHFLINYVSVDGNLYRQEKSIFYYKQEINKILNVYGLNTIKCFGD